jgi:rubrerythrin
MTKNQFSQMTIEEVIEEALRREHHLVAFYQSLLGEVGDDALPLMNKLLRAHKEHFLALQELEEEVRLHRDMTIAMVD